MRTLSLLASAGVTACLLFGGTPDTVEGSTWSPTSTQTSVPMGTDRATEALYADLGLRYPPARPHSVWVGGHNATVAQQNQCACYTYANSVCTGPCQVNGLPAGCLCNTH
jgi:hypothetical protein